MATAVMERHSVARATVMPEPVTLIMAARPLTVNAALSSPSTRRVQERGSAPAVQPAVTAAAPLTTATPLIATRETARPRAIPRPMACVALSGRTT